MKLLIFGTGTYFKNRRDMLSKIGQNDTIIGYIDNQAENIVEVDGCPVYMPEAVASFDYDKILLMSKSAQDMKEQLLELNVDEADIYSWEIYLLHRSHGKIRFVAGNTVSNNGSKVLVVYKKLDYEGGSIAAVYAAKCLRDKGHDVYIAAQDADDAFLYELKKGGFNVIIAHSIFDAKEEDFFWINLFDIVIVNCFSMIASACQISCIRPIIWWLHDPSDAYKYAYDYFDYFGHCVAEKIDINNLKSINICAVSEIAKRNFEKKFDREVDGLLSYGIPDEFDEKEKRYNDTKKIIFAIVGIVSKRKGQDVFLSAINLLPEKSKEGSEFWIIGSYGDDEYGKKIQQESKRISGIELLGRMTREEMRRIYPQIDVLVCSSREDPMPIVVTEGMMHEKVCIISDAVGQKDFIIDEEDGLLCKAEDASSLATKMEWVLRHREKLMRIGKNARKVYEDNFSMKQFGENLELEINRAKAIYNQNAV